MEDPVVQAQMMDMQNKQAEVQRKQAKDQADVQLRQQQQHIEVERIASQERIAGMNAGIKASSQKQVNDQNLDISNAKIHLEAMRTGADLLKGRS
jgi:hypothetical protein